MLLIIFFHIFFIYNYCSNRLTVINKNNNNYKRYGDTYKFELQLVTHNFHQRNRDQIAELFLIKKKNPTPKGTKKEAHFIHYYHNQNNQ